MDVFFLWGNWIWFLMGLERSGIDMAPRWKQSSDNKGRVYTELFLSQGFSKPLYICITGKCDDSYYRVSYDGTGPSPDGAKAKTLTEAKRMALQDLFKWLQGKARKLEEEAARLSTDADNLHATYLLKG